MNMPFGAVGAGEFGTYFIGYARSPDVIEQMLTNMFIGNPPGNTDRILDFSTAITGTLFFAPSADFLDDPPGAPGTADPADPAGVIAGPDAGPASTGPASTGPAGDGSLGIGSLKG
jgi:putative iron-dependent peroxidase